MYSADPAVSVVVVTHDRDAELAVCLASLRRQTVPLEVIIMDDKGGADTPHVVADLSPGARYLNIASGRGPSFQRNYGIRVASSEFVFLLDDDTELVNPTTIERTLADFIDPGVAAVGIPFVNVRMSGEVRHRAPIDSNGTLHAFVGAAHAVRRSAFFEVGGYREHYFYMGEEGDLCIRLLDRGYVVKAGAAPPVHHFESPRRNSRRAAVCGRKNDILFAFHNVPQPYLLPHLAGTIANGIGFGLRSGHLGWHLQGIAVGVQEMLTHRRERSPVSRATYKIFRHLKRAEASQAVAQTAPT